MDKCMKNIKKLAYSFNIYVVMKENRVYGKIYARFTEAACHLSFISYFDDIPNIYKLARGYGYNKMDQCMREILNEFSENFIKNGVILDFPNDNWKKAFETGGYYLIYVI